MPTPRFAVAAAAVVASLGAAAMTTGGEVRNPEQGDVTTVRDSVPFGDSAHVGEPSVVTLAFAGDVHFQIQLADLLQEPRGTLGPLTKALADADVAMVNLESAITSRGSLEAKELENPGDRYWFRTTPAALSLLHRSGVDVVTMANNHGADYGPVGVADTLRARRNARLAVLGIGRNRADAFAAHRVSVKGTDLAFLAADASRLESQSSVWSAGPRNAGIAAARSSGLPHLLAAVRSADRTADAVIVYLHWGSEGESCPNRLQRTLADRVAGAGADVIVGSHAHRLQGSGWLGSNYVNYGLGNFLWYTGNQPTTGVLRVRLVDGVAVADDWVPGRIGPWGGRPARVTGADRRAAIADWRRLRSCTHLSGPPGSPAPAVAGDAALPAYSSSVARIGPALARRMASSHRPGCPVALRDLRHLRLAYVGFDGRRRLGEMVVHRALAADVVGIFGRLYDARWPIARMRLVDDFAGNDNRSMAANNTSGYNCRRVAGHVAWSDHAYGAAIDLNPVQNPYLTGDSVAPPSGRQFRRVQRDPGSSAPAGVVVEGDAVHRAFTAAGWEWGGAWTGPKDYQHFSAPLSRRTSLAERQR